MNVKMPSNKMSSEKEYKNMKEKKYKIESILNRI